MSKFAPQPPAPPNVLPQRYYRFAAFVKPVPFATVSGTIDGALTARLSASIVAGAMHVSEIVESAALGGSLEVVLQPDARNGQVQRRCIPWSNVISAERVK
jgi:hypothetical protein